MNFLISEVGKGNFDSNEVNDFLLINQKKKEGIFVKDNTKYKIKINTPMKLINK